MLLTGTYQRTLDDKKRLVFPKRVREQLGEPRTLFIGPGPDQCLWVNTQEEQERLSERLKQMPNTGDVRVFKLLYFGQTEAVDVDRTGRILIPDRLLQLGGLGNEVVLIGVDDHLELWDATRWQQYLEQNGPRFDAVSEGAFRGQ